MPATKVIKPEPVEATGKTPERPKPVKVRTVTGAQSELRVPAVRKSRASSCPRCPPRGRCERRAGAQGAAVQRSSERRTRSSSTHPRADQDHRTAIHAAVNPKCRDMTSSCLREQRGVRTETSRASQSHKAFTIIPPNPKRRREIQRKAEAELAALEELRLSRAMAYVSINPSSV
ncbi:uncharacterized protein zgc:194621, partial [Plectropomus leopardus]|uniref:uncharacterized protein zgc:194621 n=1 Tax=Plectropomus leopardus TaxID=160734 RepID=UPI001C4B5570